MVIGGAQLVSKDWNGVGLVSIPIGRLRDCGKWRPLGGRPWLSVGRSLVWPEYGRLRVVLEVDVRPDLSCSWIDGCDAI